jgi:hypothetical protein
MRNSTVMVWDLGGQAGLRGIWDKYFEGACILLKMRPCARMLEISRHRITTENAPSLADAHAIVWVVDAANDSRLDEVRQQTAFSFYTPVCLLCCAGKCQVGTPAAAWRAVRPKVGLVGQAAEVLAQVLARRDTNQ